MPILPLALPTQSSQGESPHAGVASLLNCYVVPEDTEQKSKIRIRASAGLEPLTSVSATGGVRRMLEVDGVLVSVIGRQIWQIDSGGSGTFLGAIPSDGYVGIARNQRATGVQTAVVCDGLAKVITGGGVVSMSLPIPAIDVCTINRSGVYVAADGRMARSEPDDFTDVDGLSQARAEANPDGLYRGVARGSDLIAIGPRSVEVWSDTGGGEAFGFSRANTITIGAVGPGCVGTGTVLGQQVQDTTAWIANNDQGRFIGVIMLSGYTPQKISTAWVDRKIDAVADKTSITATSWVERGRSFLGWRLPDVTLVYDTSTGLWHEKQSRDAYGDLTAWQIGQCAVLGGRVVGAAIDSASFFWVDPDAKSEAGTDMIMRVRTPPLSAFPGRVEVNRLFLDIVPGVGIDEASPAGELDVLLDDDGAALLDDDGAYLTDDDYLRSTTVAPETDPIVALRTSRDGEVWTRARSARIGRAGERAKRIYWNACGTHHQVTTEFTVSASVVREILSASWEGKTLPP